MIAKEYLKQYRAIDDRVQILKAEIEKIRADAESMSINLDGMPRGSATNDKTARLAITLADYETELVESMLQLWSMKMKIIGMLDELKDSKYQRILYSRYIEGKTWEIIAYEMDVSWRYCYMLHGYALQEFDRILKKKK